VPRRIGCDVVLQRHGNVDYAAGHPRLPSKCWCVGSSLAEHCVLQDADPIDGELDRVAALEKAPNLQPDLARNDPIIFYAASRKFAEDHPDVIKAFRAAIDEAAPMVNSDRETATQSIAKFTKMPIDLVRQTRPDLAKPELKGSDLAWWIETMKQQDMLQGSPDLTKLVLP
jgi:hypothetical protein